MPELNFRVEGAKVVPYAAAPTLALDLRIEQGGGQVPIVGSASADQVISPADPITASAEADPTTREKRSMIHAIALRCQVRIEATRRHYRPEEQERLIDLFDQPQRWGETLRSFLWTHVNLNVPRFTQDILLDLPLPCSFDFALATTKYFDALQDGDVPLILLFNGSVFHQPDDGPLQVAQIPWEKEARFNLPVRIWKQMMQEYYPNTAWLCLRKDLFDQLSQFKSRMGLATWEQTIERLMCAQTSEAIR